MGDISSISGSESSDNSDNEEGEKTKKFALPEPVFNKGGADSSDSDSEMSVHVEGIGRRHPRVFVRNDRGQLLSVYRCVVHSKKVSDTLTLLFIYSIIVFTMSDNVHVRISHSILVIHSCGSAQSSIV